MKKEKKYSLQEYVKTFVENNEQESWIFHLQECPYSCKFCMLGGNKPSYKNLNPIGIYQEFSREFKKYKNTNRKINFSDPITNLPNRNYREFFFELIKLISEDKDYQKDYHMISIYGRINHFDYEYVEFIREMSKKIKFNMFIGIENFDDDVLEDMNKKFKYEDIKHTMKKISSLHIDLTMFLIFGTPKDSEKSFELNIKRLEEIKHILLKGNIGNFLIRSERLVLFDGTYYANNIDKLKFPDEENTEARKKMFNKKSLMPTRIILDIDQDYFFLPVFSGTLIQPQSKRDEVYYKAPKQLDEVIEKFNLKKAKPHFKVFKDHDEVYHELKQMKDRCNYILIHLDAHSDIEMDRDLRPVDLGNWITHLINEDMIERDIYWINQSTENTSREKHYVNGKEYTMNISNLDNFNFSKEIDITFWTYSKEFCPTNNLLPLFVRKLPNLTRLN